MLPHKNQQLKKSLRLSSTIPERTGIMGLPGSPLYTLSLWAKDPVKADPLRCHPWFNENEQQICSYLTKRWIIWSNILKAAFYVSVLSRPKITLLWAGKIKQTKTNKKIKSQSSMQLFWGWTGLQSLAVTTRFLSSW